MTLELQARISSPEIQRMHEFQLEIDADMELLGETGSQEEPLHQYRELYTELGDCMKACNHYHEEAFLLEDALRGMMEAMNEQNANQSKIREQLKYETANYLDLRERIDTSLAIAQRQAEIFYGLKPMIEELKEQLEMP
jgi:hypothetical protein